MQATQPDVFSKISNCFNEAEKLEKDPEESWRAETTKATNAAIDICRDNGVFLWLEDLEDIFYQNDSICESLYTEYKRINNPSSVGHIDINIAKAKEWVKKSNGLHDNWKDIPFKTVMDAVKIIADSNDEFIKFCKYLAKQSVCMVVNLVTHSLALL